MQLGAAGQRQQLDGKGIYYSKSIIMAADGWYIRRKRERDIHA